MKMCLSLFSMGTNGRIYGALAQSMLGINYKQQLLDSTLTACCDCKSS
jgi:hypothetical protein